MINERTITSTVENIMEFEGYLEVAAEEFSALEAKLHPNLDRDLELFKDLITSMIETEIVQRAYYKKGVLIHQLSNDKVFDKAVELLQTQLHINLCYNHVQKGCPTPRRLRKS